MAIFVTPLTKDTQLILRNKARDELTSRYDELNGYMDSFIKKYLHTTVDCVS